MDSPEQTSRSPEEAAAIILARLAVLNEKSRLRGWKDKLSLGRAAIDCGMRGADSLSWEEVSAGERYITEQNDRTAEEAHAAAQRRADLGLGCVGDALKR